MPRGQLRHVQYVWLRPHEMNSAGFYFPDNCLFDARRRRKKHKDDEDVDTSFQTRGRGCQNCLFWQPCTFLANKRQLCARELKSFLQKAAARRQIRRELTNSWPSIYRGLQWTCHHPLWCISIRFLSFFCHLQMGPLFIKAAAVNLPSSCKRRLWCLEA